MCIKTRSPFRRRGFIYSHRSEPNQWQKIHPTLTVMTTAVGTSPPCLGRSYSAPIFDNLNSVRKFDTTFRENGGENLFSTRITDLAPYLLPLTAPEMLIYNVFNMSMH